MNNHQQKEKGRPPPVHRAVRRDGQKFQNCEFQHCTTPKSFEKWELQTCKTGF